jgi:hypothetical protein
MSKGLLGWASNILNVIVFIILLLNTKAQCVDSGQIISSVIMIAISFLVQIIDSIGLENESKL